MVSCIFIGTLLVAAENPLLRCFVLVFTLGTCCCTVVSDLSKSLYLDPHPSVWSEDLLTGARMILVFICDVCRHF